MKPILKYIGGKSKEIDNYRHTIPQFETYFEPFLGGGATFFHFEPKSAVIGDVNANLMDFYRDVASDKFFEIKKELKTLQTLYLQNHRSGDKTLNEKLYYDIRDMLNGKKEAKYSRAAIYYFLNKTSFSGLVRFNKQGLYNVPYGKYAHFIDRLTEDHHNLLAQAELYCGSYEQSFERATERDFIFLDPPYHQTFSEYGNEAFSGKFDEDAHRKLAEDFQNLSAPALMIIGKTDLTSELYKNHITGWYKKSYSVNMAAMQSNDVHLIVRNYNN